MIIGCLIDSVSRNAGGLFESVRNLAKVLHINGAEVRVFGIEDSYSLDESAEWSPLNVQIFPVRGPRALGVSPTVLPALRETGLDVLLNHGLWKYTSLATRRWHKKTCRPYVVHPHGMLDPWALNNSRWKKRLAAIAYENSHLRHASCIRALCEAEARAIRSFGLKNPICVIPNGINAPGPAEPAYPPLTRTGRPTLLYLGRLHAKKNLPALIQGWHEAQRRLPSLAAWKLTIAGWDQGGHEAELKEQVSELDLSTTVEFCGPLFGASKRNAYRECAGFILPSFSEGLPMVVLEAWSYGKPVLMTPACNLPEGFGAGAAIPINTDSSSIATGILGLAEMTRDERCRMGERGRRLTLERFAWADIGQEMFRVCEWVLGGGSPPASLRFD